MEYEQSEVKRESSTVVSGNLGLLPVISGVQIGHVQRSWRTHRAKEFLLAVLCGCEVASAVACCSLQDLAHRQQWHCCLTLHLATRGVLS